VTVVVDASVILAFLLPDEDSALGQRLFTDPELKLVAPALARVEVVNGLVTAFRRGRLPESSALKALGIFGRLDIEYLGEFPADEKLFLFAVEKKVAAYDAVYLSLALEARAPLATVDRLLAAAAASEDLLWSG
jgi:predicted nucleic acid-binding protein